MTVEWVIEEYIPLLKWYFDLLRVGQLFQRDGRVIFDWSTGLAMLHKKSMFCIAEIYYSAIPLLGSFIIRPQPTQCGWNKIRQI